MSINIEREAGKSWRPVAAGVVNIAFGLLSLLGVSLSIYFSISIAAGRSRLERVLREASRAFPAILVFLSAVFLIVGILLIAGAIFAFQRKNWSVAATGSGAAVVFAILAGIPLLNYSVPAVLALAGIGVASAILMIRSKQEFS